MIDIQKHGGVIAISGAVILYFLFRNKSKTTPVSAISSPVDNSTLNAPNFKPADYSVGDAMNSFNPSYYFSGGGLAKNSANSLSDKYIPLFGFIGGISYKTNTYDTSGISIAQPRIGKYASSS